MAINFSVKTQAEAYNEGYKDAMADIARQMEDGGLEAVAEWVRLEAVAEWVRNNS